MDPYQTAIEDRIRELVRYRKWLRDWPFLQDYLDEEYRIEVRGLLRTRSTAKRAQRAESKRLAKGDHFARVVGGFSVVPGPTDRELREETWADRELMRDEMHGRDIDGSLRW